MSIGDVDNAAFRLKLELRNFTGEPAGTLFVVECEFCGGRCGGDIDFPLIPAADFAEWTWRAKPRQRFPTMSWTSFKKILTRARALYNDENLELVPNSGLGPIEIEPIGRWPKVLRDIDLASPGGVLFSQQLIDNLRQRGFQLPFQPTTLANSLGRRYPYGIMQPRVYRLMHPETFVKNPAYWQCGECGEIRAINPMVKPPSQIHMKSVLRGKTEHLFRVVGYTGFVFVSDALKKALDEIQPSGLMYDAFGIWAD